MKKLNFTDSVEENRTRVSSLIWCSRSNPQYAWLESDHVETLRAILVKTLRKSQGEFLSKKEKGK